MIGNGKIGHVETSHEVKTTIHFVDLQLTDNDIQPREWIVDYVVCREWEDEAGDEWPPLVDFYGYPLTKSGEVDKRVTGTSKFTPKDYWDLEAKILEITARHR